MKRQLVFITIIAIAIPYGFGDTFTHKTKDGIVYTGYAGRTDENGMTEVFTQEAGKLTLNLSEYDVQWNTKGRKPTVAVLPIMDEIEYEYKIAAFEKAITEEAENGPYLILIELDTPGGRVDLAKRYCAAIKAVTNCKTVAYICGGNDGGAFSAGAAISLACDDIYMAPGTTIGAATMITYNESGKTVDMKEAFGEAVGEKFNAAWRNYLASLAEDKNRSGAIAKAMADKDIVVVEVMRKGKTKYVERAQQYPDDHYVRTICNKGQLLALPANDALKYGIANGLASSRQDVLEKLGCSGATFQTSAVITDAQAEYEKVQRKFDVLREKIDLQYKEIVAKSEHQTLTRRQAVKDLDALRRSSEYLLRLKQANPDIPVSEESLQRLINTIRAEYESLKAVR